MQKRRVRVIHSSRAEVAYVGRLDRRRWLVESGPVTSPKDLQGLRKQPPAVFVIDVSRAPAHGRDIGLGLRQYSATRGVPQVFVDADAQQVARLKKVLPGAVCCRRSQLAVTLDEAVAKPRAVPAKPVSALAGYSGTPLSKKIGIKTGAVVVLVRAPEGFEQAMGKLPSDVVVRRRNQGRRDLTIWFTRSLKELEKGIASMAMAFGAGRLWIIWPKRTSHLAADHTETDVRRVGLASGLVDYKICAIDQDWSGLLFARRSR